MGFITDILKGKKTLKVDNSPAACLYPFFNIMLTANGQYKPCCKWSEVLHHQGEIMTDKKFSLEDAWHSSQMEEIRGMMLKQSFPTQCEVCKKEEDNGIRSMRYDSFEYGITEDIFKNYTSPKRLDLYLSNICNLRCRICSPEYSSKWIKEGQDSQGIVETAHLNFKGKNKDFIYNILPQIIEIGLFGGEPFYIKESSELLQYCIEKGFAQNITLLINTNTSVYTQEIIQLLKSFKKVYLNFSIDDIEQRFEYQRKDAIWTDTEKNLGLFLQHRGFHAKNKIECKICCTVSALNVLYLPELFQWRDEKFPGLPIYLNMLHGPTSLSSTILPLETRKKIVQKLQQSSNKNSIRTFDDVIEMLSMEQEIDINPFIKEIQRGDLYRKESFSAVFPELSAMIKEASGVDLT